MRMALTGRTLSKPTSTKLNPMKSMKSLEDYVVGAGFYLFIVGLGALTFLGAIGLGANLYRSFTQSEQANVCKCAEIKK